MTTWTSIGPSLAVADILEHLDQPLDVMPVDRADIIEAELLEERAAGHHAAREFLALSRGVVDARAAACAASFFASLRKPRYRARD